MERTSLRPATLDDLDQVAAIEAASIRPPWSKEAFRAELEKKHAHFFVLTDDETDSKIFAYIVFSFPAEQAHIQTIAVNPKTRRRGFGTKILRDVIAFVMRKKGETLILEVRESNKAALALYQTLGFVVIHRMPKFYPDGEAGFALLYNTKQNKLTGDPETDFDTDNDADDPRPKNLN